MNTHSGRSIKKLYTRSIRALRRSNHDDAVTLTQEIIDRQTDHAGAHAVQFSSLFKSKQFESARLIGNQAAELNPKSVFILNNQACLELEKNNPAPAAHLLTSLIEQFGERAQWVYNLALAHEKIGQYGKAVSMYRKTLDQDPKHDKAARKLAETSALLGHYEEATQAYDYYRLLQNKNDASHSLFINCAAKSNNITNDSLLHELNLWGARFIPQSKRYDVEDINSKEVLTIGFIAAYFDYEWLENIFTPVINQLSENGDNIIFYSRLPAPSLNENVKQLNVSKLSDANFARRVREDKVDVLIDLCGMSNGHRQRAMGLQLASKQYSWLNHEGAFTTPLIDSLDDKLEQFFIAPTSNKASKKKWPAKTFAGLSGQNGLSYDVIKAWAAVLVACPQWSLNINTIRLKRESAKFSEVTKEQVEKLLQQRFSAAGVDRSRVSFNNSLEYDKTTIALDNFSNNDPVALSECILNGATAVTLKGELFPAQRNIKLMTQLSLDETMSETPYLFSQRAISLAQGKSKMCSLRDQKTHQTKLNDLESFVTRFRKTILD